MKLRVEISGPDDFTAFTNRQLPGHVIQIAGLDTRHVRIEALGRASRGGVQIFNVRAHVTLSRVFVD
jgi:hypothetical protein